MKEKDSCTQVSSTIVLSLNDLNIYEEYSCFKSLFFQLKKQFLANSSLSEINPWDRDPETEPESRIDTFQSRQATFVRTTWFGEDTSLYRILSPHFTNHKEELKSNSVWKGALALVN